MRYISNTPSGSSGPLQKVGAILATVAVAATVLLFSSVFFAVLLVALAIGGVVLWWKTRHMRRMMRELQAGMNRAREAYQNGGMGQDGGLGQGPSPREGAFSREESFRGVIIEGEAVRVDERGDARGR
jgi:hypothetical protein